MHFDYVFKRNNIFMYVEDLNAEQGSKACTVVN